MMFWASGVSKASLEASMTRSNDQTVHGGTSMAPRPHQRAALLKRVAGQINVVIHALGILLCLPYILELGEEIHYVSLGAGNTGRDFDLETNRRIAEFKFIHWQGGPETIRQNALFKDFYQMAEHATDKQRFLYVLGTGHVDKFFHGGVRLTAFGAATSNWGSNLLRSMVIVIAW
jgi:hypothetical protein